MSLSLLFGSGFGVGPGGVGVGSGPGPGVGWGSWVILCEASNSAVGAYWGDVSSYYLSIPNLTLFGSTFPKPIWALSSPLFW